MAKKRAYAIMVDTIGKFVKENQGRVSLNYDLIHDSTGYSYEDIAKSLDYFYYADETSNISNDMLRYLTVEYCWDSRKIAASFWSESDDRYCYLKSRVDMLRRMGFFATDENIKKMLEQQLNSKNKWPNTQRICKLLGVSRKRVLKVRNRKFGSSKM